MSLTVIVGGFYGDEGKGKVSAYLSLKDDVNVAVRTGAVNAGHTVTFKNRVWKLRIVPSAFLNRRTKLMIAPGALLRLDVLWKEMEETNCKNRLIIDRHVGIITKNHIEFEHSNSYLSKTIGSTRQGVGAAMADRVLRRLKLAKDYEELKEYIGDVALEVNKAVDEGLNVIIEGTQGLQLSLYHGDYPFVTSRDTTASSILGEVGIGPKKVDNVIVVLKSYVTRVGGGNLPGELSLEEAKKRGWIERATVTGRLRRVAPFNMELARRAVMINSATQVAITKIDVLFPQDRGVKSWDKLSKEAREWVENIEHGLKVPVTLIGTGEEVYDIIDRRSELNVRGGDK